MSLFKCEKTQIFFKKGSDKGGRIWYSKRAVREGSGVLEGRGKKVQKNLKKALDKRKLMW